MTYERYTYSVPNPSAIQSIVLVDADVSVEVLSSGDGSMHIEYFESEREHYDIDIDGATFSVRKRVSLMAGIFSLLSGAEPVKLTMYVPEGYDGELSVATADGDIRVYGVTMAEMAIKTVDGDIAVNRTHIRGRGACKTIDGDIAAGGLTAAELSLKTTDGDIMLDRPLVGSRLTCRTTDGDIKGWLAGRAADYTLAVRKVDGRSNVATGGTGKTLCELKTVDGNISILFEDDR